MNVKRMAAKCIICIKSNFIYATFTFHDKVQLTFHPLLNVSCVENEVEEVMKQSFSIARVIIRPYASETCCTSFK